MLYEYLIKHAAKFNSIQAARIARPPIQGPRVVPKTTPNYYSHGNFVSDEAKQLVKLYGNGGDPELINTLMAKVQAQRLAGAKFIR